MTIQLSRPSCIKCVVTEPQYAFLRGCLKRGWRHIVNHPTMARNLERKGLGKIAGWRFYVNAAGR